MNTPDDYGLFIGDFRRADAELTAEIGSIFGDLAAIAHRLVAVEDRRRALETQAGEAHWAGTVAGVRVQGQPDDVRPLALRAPVPAQLARRVLDALDQMSRHG